MKIPVAASRVGPSEGNGTDPRLRVNLDHVARSWLRPDSQRVATAHVLLCEACSDQPNGLPPALQADLLRALGQRGRDAYGVIGGARATFRPSAVVPNTAGHAWATTARDAVAEASPDDVARELGDKLTSDAATAARWNAVKDDPRPWLNEIGTGLLAASAVVDRVCDRLADGLERERRRVDIVVGSAAGVADILSGISDHVTAVGGELQMPASCDVRVAAGDQLVVLPVIAPQPVRVLMDRGMDRTLIYSVASSPAPASQDTQRYASVALEALLGRARASVLVALDKPRTMGYLARSLNYAPSTLTHHVRRLVDAGMVATERSNKWVRVERTMAGHIVVDLLGHD